MCFTENIAFSLMGILIGYFIGNRLAIGRDKRNEFNEVAVPITLKLMRQLEILNENHLVDSLVSDNAFKELRLHLSKRKGIRYNADLEKYKESIKNSGHWEKGETVVDDLTEYIKATKKMLDYSKRK
jgi:hypothetical protein